MWATTEAAWSDHALDLPFDVSDEAVRAFFEIHLDYLPNESPVGQQSCGGFPFTGFGWLVE